MNSFTDALRRRIQHSETTGPLVTAVVVGLGAGMGAVVLRALIAGAQRLFFGGGGFLTGYFGLEGPYLGRIHYLVVPALGMVIVSWMVRRFAPEAGGHGIPEVQYALRRNAGRIRPRVALVKAVTSAISIGSGGSVGREGPIVQIGSAMGSAVGQFLGVGREQLTILVAAGAAGAIGGTFNAPVAGVMFAVEVILTSFAARSLGLVVIAAMTATAFTQAALGRQPAFELTQTFVLVNEAEFALYILLGVITGTLATLYIQLVYGFERIFDEWSARPWLKALTGGLVVGAMGLFGSEHLFGVGHEGVELALNGDLLLSTMVLLVFLKMVATSVTLGAGGSGGVFAPALFVGAMAGGAFGVAVHGLYPTWTAPPGAYALVGMAALFGGAAHAPVTAMVILFEMTDNYEIVLPLMLTVVISYLMASRIFPDSIYSLKLRRRGALQPLRESSLLDVLMVNDAMSDAFDTVSPATTIGELSALARSKRTRSWPVVGADGRLQGIVTETDLLARDASGRSDATVGEIMTPTVVTCRSRDPLSTAMRRFAEMDVQLIPVVDDADPRIVHGVLRRSEMRWVAHTLADEHRRLLDEREEGLGGIATGMVQVSFTVPPSGSDIAFRKLNEVGTPSDTLIVLVRRGGRSFVPVGRTRIEPGDELLFLTTDEKEPELREWLGPDAITGNPAPADGTPSPRSH